MGRARMKRYTNEGMIDQNRPPESSLDGSQYKCESTAMAYCGLFLETMPCAHMHAHMRLKWRR